MRGNIRIGIILIAAFQICNTGLFAQTGMDSLLERPVIRCGDVAVNAINIFQGNVMRGRMDSAAMVLDQWHRKCPETEAWQRSRILELLARPALVDTALSEDIISDLVYYRYLNNYPKAELARQAPQIAAYLSFTQAWSAQLTPSFSPGMVEYGLGQFYGTNADLLFPAIQRGEYADTKLSRKYFEAVDHVVNLPEMHLAASLGIWVPTGELSAVGAHPELGFQIGAKDRRMNYDLAIGFRFLSAPEPYLARRKGSDTLELTSYYFGGHIGIDVGRDIYRSGPNEVQLIGGLGYDGFDTFKTKPGSEDDSGTAGSFDLSVGLGYRCYLTSWHYVGMEAMYHMVNYVQNQTVDMRGQPFLVSLVYGGLSGAKQEQLGSLQYKLRQ